MGYKLKFSNYFILKEELEKAELNFREIIKTIMLFTETLNLDLSEEKILTYTNYSLLLKKMGKIKESIKFCDLAIQLIESVMLENDYSNHIALIKLYFQKLELTNDITLKDKIKFHSSKINYNPKTLIWKKIADEL